MRQDVLERDLGALRRTVRFQRLVVAGLGLLVLLIMIHILRTSGRERVILVPPTLSKSVWVDADKVSATYLEEMGDFVSRFILNVTPESVDYNQALVLKYVSPEVEPALKVKMRQEAERLKRDNATTVFFPKSIQAREAALAVAVEGRLQTFVHDRRVSEVSRTYLAEFEYAKGKLYLKSFKEAGDDPFKQKATSQLVGVVAPGDSR